MLGVAPGDLCKDALIELDITQLEDLERDILEQDVDAIVQNPRSERERDIVGRKRLLIAQEVHHRGEAPWEVV